MFLAALFIITMETKLETSKMFITWKQKKGGMFIQWNIIQQLKYRSVHAIKTLCSESLYDSVYMKLRKGKTIEMD